MTDFQEISKDDKTPALISLGLGNDEGRFQLLSWS